MQLSSAEKSPCAARSLKWISGDQGKLANQLHKVCICSPASRFDGPLDKLYELIGPEHPATDVRGESAHKGQYFDR